MKLIIPKKENLVPLKYEYIDSTIDQYYRPIQGHFMKKRLQMALDLLGDKKVGKILDVGYGGGTFITTLAKLAKEVHGIDTFPPKKVEDVLKKEGIKAKLIKASIFKTPYKNNFFDRIVCISVMEHFKGKELNKAILEMHRILKPGGFIILGFPVKNPMTDFIIEQILKFKPNDIHPSGHKQIINAVESEVKIDKKIHYFDFLPLDYSLYCVIKVKK